MKYFLDFEFAEGFHKPLFGKNRHYIDMISVGIVAEDGREFYAISNEFDLKEVWNRHEIKEIGDARNMYGDKQTVKEYWLRDNVLLPIYTELRKLAYRSVDKESQFSEFYFNTPTTFTFANLKRLIKFYGKSNKQIAKEIVEFIYPDSVPYQIEDNISGRFVEKKYENPEFYGYYADYDWVLFCSLYGKMINLPKGFPMYCRDLKQMYDEKDSIIFKDGKSVRFHNDMKSGANIYDIKKLKEHGDYPKQTNEHNALDDAKWNLKLFNFLQTL